MGANVGGMNVDSGSDRCQVDDVIIFFATLLAAPDETVIVLLKEAKG
jgi:hypothetical protein